MRACERRDHRQAVAVRPQRTVSTRQRRILQQLAHDWTDHRIAKALGISDRQVRREIQTLCSDFKATGRIQLVCKALVNGVLPVSTLRASGHEARQLAKAA